MKWFDRLFRMPPAQQVARDVPAAEIGTKPARYPNAFLLPKGGGAELFDPALKHHDNAYREGEPPIADVDGRARWYAARRQILEFALRRISESPCRDHLVLRGSATLSAWLGDQARRPGDLDWVVVPFEWSSNSAKAQWLLREVIAAIETGGSRVGEIAIDTTHVARDDIWTYERAEGRRLTFSWAAPGLPPGKLQCDFVFGEALWVPSQILDLPASDGRAINVLAATPEQSLAWKMLWLLNDWYPQGKDLYDAVLLAERCTLSLPLLDCLVSALREEHGSADLEDRVSRLTTQSAACFGHLDWAAFVAEYPGVDPDLVAWGRRFVDAVAPVLAHARRADDSSG
jgi:hypothetical protein